MNYKQLCSELDRARGQVSALKVERDNLVKANASSNRSARYHAHKRGLAEGSLSKLQQLMSGNS